MADVFLYPATKAALKRLLHRKQGGLCCYCERPISLFPTPKGQRLVAAAPPDHLATLEHLRRIADGGDSHPDNLALACVRCNNARGEMNWVEFKTLMSRAA